MQEATEQNKTTRGLKGSGDEVAMGMGAMEKKGRRERVTRTLLIRDGIVGFEAQRAEII